MVKMDYIIQKAINITHNLKKDKGNYQEYFGILLNICLNSQWPLDGTGIWQP